MRSLFILLGLLLGLYLLHRYRKLSEKKQKKLIGVFLMAGVVVLLLVLAISGKLHWLVAVTGALLALIPRGMRFFLGAWPAVKPFFQRYQKNHQSNMRSRFIRLQIDMLSGEWQGDVLQGDFAGSQLQVMSVDQLLLLLETCKQVDVESAELLVAYLNHKHPGWEGQAQYSNASPDMGGAMNEQQARDILGVSDVASKEAVIEAHKRLIQKVHPDRGGSDYLAQQINKARDTLLK